MRKFLKLSLRVFIYFLLLIILSLVIVGYWANSTLQQQGSEHNIERFYWQSLKFESQQLSLEQLGFLYRETYQIEVQGLQITSSNKMFTAVKNLFTQSRSSYPSISVLEIEHLNIEILGTKPQTANEKSPPIYQILETLQKKLKNIAQTPAHILIPEAIHINRFSLHRPCPAQTEKNCELSSKFDVKLDLNPESITGQVQLHAFDTELPELTFNSKMAFILSLQQPLNSIELSIHTQITHPETLHLNVIVQTKADTDSPQLTLNTETRGNFPKTQQLKGFQYAFTDSWQAFIDLYRRWNPIAINPIELAELITPFLPAGVFSAEKPEFQFSTHTQVPLTTVFQASINDLVTLELPTDFSAQINRPVTVPNIASVSGSLKGNVTVQNNQLTGYSMQAKALATDLMKPQWFEQQGWQINTLEIDLQSEQQLNHKKLQQLPFQIVLQGLAKTGSQVSRLQSNSQGFISLNGTPSLNIKKAHLELNNPKLKLDPSIALTNVQVKTDFTAQIHAKGGDIQIQQARGTANLSSHQQTLKVNHLQIDHLDLQIPEFSRLAKTLKLKAKKLILNGHFQSPEIQLENLTTTFKNIHLQSNQQHRKSFSASYHTNINLLKHPQLRAQSWQTSGVLSSKFKGLDSINSFQSIKLKGDLQNTAGIRADYNANFSPKKWIFDWVLADQYLLAGNPIKKTWVHWPKLLSLSSGKLSANGTLTVDPKTLLSDNNAPLLEAIKAKSDIGINGLDGIYNETAFSQLELKAKLQLEESQLYSDIETFKVDRLNHGLIVGPIDVIAQTQTPLENWLATEIQLQKAELGIFEGKAHLDSKTIYLDKEVSGKLRLEDVNLQALLLQYPTAELYGTGRLHGNLPFSLNLANRTQQKPVLQISKGKVSASESGGILQYQADSTGLKQVHKSMEVLLTVLEDFHYKVLDSQISLDEQQKLRLKLRLEGNNPKVEQGRQVNLNIQIEEDLPALITSMQISNQINSTIQQRIQKKLQRERGLK